MPDFLSVGVLAFAWFASVPMICSWQVRFASLAIERGPDISGIRLRMYGFSAQGFGPIRSGSLMTRGHKLLAAFRESEAKASRPDLSFDRGLVAADLGMLFTAALCEALEGTHQHPVACPNFGRLLYRQT